MTSADAAAPGPPRARAGPAHRGTPPPREREQLAVRYGATLRYERRRLGWGVGTLASAAGIHERSIWRVESGERRPSRALCWRLAKALRAGSDDLAIAALAERLALAAGPSLVDHSRKAHRRRARLAAAVRGETGQGIPADVAGDDLCGLILAELIKRSAPPS